MRDSFKNDPLMKTILALIVGIIGLGIVFSLVFSGPGFGMWGSVNNWAGMGYGGHYGMYGNTMAGGTNSYLVSLLFNLTGIGFAFFIIALIVKIILRIVNGNGVLTKEYFKNEPMVKGAAVSGIILLAFTIFMPLLATLFPQSMGYGNTVMHGTYAQGGAAGAFTLSGILTGLIKILLLLSVTGAILGVTMYFIKNYTGTTFSHSSVHQKCTACGTEINNDFTFCPSCGKNVEELHCPSCKKEIEPGWKFCPSCSCSLSSETKDTTKTETM